MITSKVSEKNMANYEKLFQHLTCDRRYLENLDWGKPRRGHPEGTVRAHIAELEQNLARLPVEVGSEPYWKLMVLIHVHDTFKKDSSKGVSIDDPRSHASLARNFLAHFCTDMDMLNMVQYHDEPYALYRQQTHKGRFNEARLKKLLARIKDWELFLQFLLVDGHTAGKSREPLFWSLEHIGRQVGLAGSMTEWLNCLSGAAVA
jgi:hypothetical protein